MNKKIFFLLAAAIALLMSCSDSVKQDTNVETDAKLYVSVQDGSNGNPLDAKVTLRSTGESKDAKVSSPAIFKAYTGQHALEVVAKLPGYASALVEAGISESCKEVGEGEDYKCANPGTHIALNTNKTVKLYPTTASLTGKLVYKDTKGQEVVAAGVTVRLAMYKDLELLNPVFYATTEADGSYKFENLPAVGTKYKIDVLPSTTAGTTFGGYNVCGGETENCRPLFSNGKADYGRQSLSKETSTNSVGYLVDFDQRVNPNQPIVFTFNDVINQKLLDRSTLVIPGTQAYSVKWEGKTLTLTPAAEWEAVELTVCFNNLKFETNQSKSNIYESCYYNRADSDEDYDIDHCDSEPNAGTPPTNYYFTDWNIDYTSPRPGDPDDYLQSTIPDFSACKTVAINATDISALTVENFVVLDTANALFGEPLDLRWSPVAGATGYELYVALKGSEKYTEITGLPSEADAMGNLDFSYTLTSAVLDARGTYKGIGGTVVFKIRAVNDKSKTAFAVFEVKDKMPPTDCTDAWGSDECIAYCATAAGIADNATCGNKCKVNGWAANSVDCCGTDASDYEANGTGSCNYISYCNNNANYNKEVCYENSPSIYSGGSIAHKTYCRKFTDYNDLYAGSGTWCTNYFGDNVGLNVTAVCDIYNASSSWWSSSMNCQASCIADPVSFFPSWASGSNIASGCESQANLVFGDMTPGLKAMCQQSYTMRANSVIGGQDVTTWQVWSWASSMCANYSNECNLFSNNSPECCSSYSIGSVYGCSYYDYCNDIYSNYGTGLSNNTNTACDSYCTNSSPTSHNYCDN